MTSLYKMKSVTSPCFIVTFLNCVGRFARNGSNRPNAIGTPRMSRALDIDLGRNKAAAITVFDANVTVTSRFAMHLDLVHEPRPQNGGHRYQ
jgi:hypothetical protein